MHNINRNNTRIIPVTVRKTIKLKPGQKKRSTMLEAQIRANCAPMRRAQTKPIFTFKGFMPLYKHTQSSKH